MIAVLHAPADLSAPSSGVLERARRYLAKCPPAVSGQRGHDATFRAACILVQGFGLPQEDALGLLKEWNVACNPPWSEAELRHKIVSAGAAPALKPRGYLRDSRAQLPAGAFLPRLPGRVVVFPGGVRPECRKPKAVFRPETLKRVAVGAGQVNERWVMDRSPVFPWTQTPASFLHRLYRPGECVVVFNCMRSQGLVLECREPPYDAGCLNHLINGCPDGVWFLCNPVDGKSHPNPRLGGKVSCRSEEAVVAWRYLVLESDRAEPRDWLAALVQMPLRIAAIYTSGGRSIHALVRVDASTKAEWDSMARPLKPFITALGGDPGAITAVRLTRLPCCHRGQTGPIAPLLPPPRRRPVDEPLEFDAEGHPIWALRQPRGERSGRWTGGALQELLYLNPEPDTQRIVDKPTHEELYGSWLSRCGSTKQEVDW